MHRKIVRCLRSYTELACRNVHLTSTPTPPLDLADTQPFVRFEKDLIDNRFYLVRALPGGQLSICAGAFRKRFNRHSLVSWIGWPSIEWQKPQRIIAGE